MRKLQTLVFLAFLCLGNACSPRQFLTRRLASELIAGSDAFKATQRFWLRTGLISNKDYLSPEYLVLQRRGWISGANATCPSEVGPPPCWEVTLTPLGIGVFKELIAQKAAESGYFSIPAAQRQLVGVTGISKNDETASVEFAWKWLPLNEVGTALYAGDVQYNSTVGFRHFDDGWRLVEGGGVIRSYQGLDDALRTAQPAQ
jgi:hypothetical protein